MLDYMESKGVFFCTLELCSTSEGDWGDISSLVAKQVLLCFGLIFGEFILWLIQASILHLWDVLFLENMFISSMAKKKQVEKESLYNLRPLPSTGTRKRNPDEDFILRGRQTPVRY